MTRERAFNEAVLKVQSEEDARKNNEARHKKTSKPLILHSTKPQKPLMKNCAFSRNCKIQELRYVIGSLLRRRTTL